MSFFDDIIQKEKKAEEKNRHFQSLKSVELKTYRELQEFRKEYFESVLYRQKKLESIESLIKEFINLFESKDVKVKIDKQGNFKDIIAKCNNFEAILHVREDDFDISLTFKGIYRYTILVNHSNDFECKYNGIERDGVIEYIGDNHIINKETIEYVDKQIEKLYQDIEKTKELIKNLKSTEMVYEIYDTDKRFKSANDLLQFIEKDVEQIYING